jgi:hypothetical protein
MIPRNLAITIVLLLLAVIGMGIYGLHLRRQALELHLAVPDARPAAPPISGPAQQVTFFVPDDAKGILIRQNVSATLPEDSTLRTREIIHLLIANWQGKNSLHPIGSSADVNAVFLLNNNQTAVVDVNSAFCEQHHSGILVEELTLASLARTLAANIPGITQMKILVDGKERETLAGHADLTGFYPTNTEWRVE